MTYYNYLNRTTPDYYPTMYQDGYSPAQILAAARKKMWKAHNDRDDGEYQVSITTEMKVKK